MNLWVLVAGGAVWYFPGVTDYFDEKEGLTVNTDEAMTMIGHSLILAYSTDENVGIQWGWKPRDPSFPSTVESVQ